MNTKIYHTLINKINKDLINIIHLYLCPRKEYYKRKYLGELIAKTGILLYFLNDKSDSSKIIKIYLSPYNYWSIKFKN
jgi:hypothetical protein